jgi:eukaryotic-like serine/threonine-protein kinase
VNDHLLGGRYRLSGRIAVGGMGEVWRGTDELLDRPVAVKLLSAAHASDDSFRARFRAEARYAASLSHPHIAQVFDYGEMSETDTVPDDLPAGGAYLVMELVQGEPLSAMIAREERLSVSDSLRIVSQAADALSAAHEAGIVHRDIKPGNLLVTPDGTTKITDFGIARAMWAAQASHLTQTGMVMGTASYVSPEQATGGTITSASDIYSLGVVAYECLTGAPPFTAETPVAIAVAHMHRPVPPLPGDVPAPVAELVVNMLAKPPEERPQSARWVADRARQLRSALPSSTGPEAQLDPQLNEAVLAETALDGGGPVLPSAEAVTDPRLGASLTRADLGLSAESSPTPPGLPAEVGTTSSETSRRRRRSALLAALVSVAVAAIGGTVAAVMLSGKPMSPAGDVAPASSSVSAPSSGAVSRAAPASSGAPQSQLPAGFAPTTPTLRGSTGSIIATDPVVKPTTRKTSKPVSKPTPTKVAPTTTGPTVVPPTTTGPTTGGGSPSAPAAGPGST